MYPISEKQLRELMDKMGIASIGEATIRQICSLADKIEEISGERMLHLEIGNPGIPAQRIGVEAECAALEAGVANKYPDISGIKPLKKAAARFFKAFLDIDALPECIIPTVGSMQGTFTVMLLLSHYNSAKKSMLFIDPGFPAQRNQAQILGMNIKSFDIYDYRGAKLAGKLDEMLSAGDVAGIIYSNPNNPAWTNLTEEELKIIGEKATAYDAIVLEDLAYLGMDFRTDFSRPYEPPFIPTVARYTDNYIQFLSSSKIFSYAGQRVSVANFSPKTAHRHSAAIEKFFHKPTLLDAYVFGVLYAVSSGTAHSAQIAFAAMLDAAADGKLDFVDACRTYKRRCEKAKKAFLDNGFHIVYDHDGDKPVSDGFFFTAGIKGMTGEKLQMELLRYGVASISLPSTGSLQQGLRICPSMFSDEENFRLLEERLQAFHDDYKK